jgi:hypothetical protein
METVEEKDIVSKITHLKTVSLFSEDTFIFLTIILGRLFRSRKLYKCTKW